MVPFFVLNEKGNNFRKRIVVIKYIPIATATSSLIFSFGCRSNFASLVSMIILLLRISENHTLQVSLSATVNGMIPFQFRFLGKSFPTEGLTGPSIFKIFYPITLVKKRMNQYRRFLSSIFLL